MHTRIIGNVSSDLEKTPQWNGVISQLSEVQRAE
jgi:hypothetical protein